MFIGRHQELKALKQAISAPRQQAKLLVITGRRRVGKSKLVEHFGQHLSSKPFYKLIGAPPQKTNRKTTELNNVAAQIAETFDTFRPILNDWNDALYAIANCVKQGECTLMIDEINWFGKTDDDISSNLFTLWESKLKDLPGFTLILTGSLASWINEHFFRSQAWYGRISWEHILQPLPLNDALRFIPNTIRERLSIIEQLRYIMVTGGIPSYLLEMNYKKPLEENLKSSAYSPGGYFFNEYDRLLHDLFRSKGPRIKHILNSLTKQKRTADDIAKALELKKPNGHLYDDLDMMIQSGFIECIHDWDIKTGDLNTRNKHYVISDPYIRFYLHCIQPYAENIRQGNSSLPKHLNGFLGLQFEYVMRQNKHLIYSLLGIDVNDVLQAAPYHARGVQIDLLVKTRRYYYMIEMKFQMNVLGSEVVRDIRRKLEHFELPAGNSIKTVLLHVNGVSPSVEKSEYIDICESIADSLNTVFCSS